MSAVKGFIALGLPVLALPALLGEAAYVVLGQIHFEFGATEIVRVVGAVSVGWMSLLTGIGFRMLKVRTVVMGDGKDPGLIGEFQAFREETRKNFNELPDRLREVTSEAANQVTAPLIGYGSRLDSAEERLDDHADRLAVAETTVGMLKQDWDKRRGA